MDQLRRDEIEPSRRLDSWKEIAAFFGRDERTVKRWEKERGLPVHRVPGKSKGSVFAYLAELKDWLHGPTSTHALSPGQDPSFPNGIASLSAAGSGPVPQSLNPSASSSEFSGGARHLRLGFLLTLLFIVVVAPILGFRLRHPGLNPSADVRSAKLPVPRTAAKPIHPANSEAEDLYLQGRYYWNKRTPANLNRAVDYFTQAIVRDPNYASAYVGLADCYNLLREFSDMPEKEAFPRALAAAKRAVELDDSLSEAHRSLAFDLFYWNWDFPGAEREFRRAIQLDPNDIEAHHWFATALMTLPGRSAEALTEIELARRLDPASQSIQADRAFVLFYAGRQEEAIQTLLQLEAAEPDFPTPYGYLSFFYLSREQYPEHFAQARKSVQLTNKPELLSLINLEERAFHSGGPQAMYEAILEEQMKRYRARQGTAGSLVDPLLHLGREQEALNYLRIACDLRDNVILGFPVNPRFAALHGDPAFRQLLDRLGLSPSS